MSTDDKNKTVLDDVNGTLGDIEKEQTKWQKTWGKTKEQTKNVVDSLTFWKKDLTEEEKLAKAQKEIDKIEKKYQKALEKAKKEQDEEKAAKIKAKAEKERQASLKKLGEKYPDQIKQVKTTPAPTQQGEEKQPKKEKTFWEKLAIWKKDLTPEEERKKAEEELDKLDKKYQKDIAEAEKAKTEEKKAKALEKAEKKYEERLNKLIKKYPNAMMAIAQEEKEAEEAEKRAQEQAQKAAEEKKRAEEAAKQKAADEKKKAEEAAKNKDKVVIDDASRIPTAEKTQDRFEERVEKKGAVKAAKNRVSKSPEQHKTETLDKWMKEVNLPAETAQKMIDKYGLDIAYKLTQRCMLEPDNLMPEVDEKYKKVQNKSKSSINYFLELDLNDNTNKNVINKVTGMELPKEERTSNQGNQNTSAQRGGSDGR